MEPKDYTEKIRKVLGDMPIVDFLEIDSEAAAIFKVYLESDKAHVVLEWFVSHFLRQKYANRRKFCKFMFTQFKMDVRKSGKLFDHLDKWCIDHIVY